VAPSSVNYYLVAELVVPVASGAPQFNFQEDPSPLLGVSLGPAAFSDRCLFGSGGAPICRGKTLLRTSTPQTLARPRVEIKMKRFALQLA
jgi:hypothetical protein